MEHDGAWIAQQLSLSEKRVLAAIALFDDGGTVPFIARYRKERTGGLDEVQLNRIQEERTKLLALSQRRAVIMKQLRETQALTPALQAALLNCKTKSELEDVYAPFKKKRTTKADQARARGLGPLADLIERQPKQGNRLDEARRFVGQHGIETPDNAFAGARDIIAEKIAHRTDLRQLVRDLCQQHGKLRSKATKNAEKNHQYGDYSAYEERALRVPSHRYLAVCRGEAEGALTVTLRPDMELTFRQVLRRCRYFPQSPFGPDLLAAVEDGFKRYLMPAAERYVRSQLRLKAEDEAIDVFQKNLHTLLLGAPLGPKSVLGIDPGIRTGCKCAFVDATGRFVRHTTLFLSGHQRPQVDEFIKFFKKCQPYAIAVGNGTGGRETEKVVKNLLTQAGLDCVIVSVNEVGASVYSASDIARQEFPELDLTVRGAISIARRLQDPLSELVKVPSQSLGVGQYQHDVDQNKLNRRLRNVAETCVNQVGVNVNTASAALLEHVAGIGPKLAATIVAHRDTDGPFSKRSDLHRVSGLGSKTFEQCAGFLRVPQSSVPLDASGVHPERYSLVSRMAQDLGCSTRKLVGNKALIETIELNRYADHETGSLTLMDIVTELLQPGRDPRAEFAAPKFRDDINDFDDVEVGMELEAVVTNVTNFGAFADIGVHQDGLIHISELSHRYIRSPHEVVSAGQRIQVIVIGVDKKRRRIALSAKHAQ
ncbi:MAG: Tex family protein [Myxococcota bacterium]|nr:Tex family protein [Myxococcota bacterium]